MSEIVLENLSFFHAKGTPFQIKALDDIALTVRAGTVTGIIGHTGSGKSTLVQMFNGILKPHHGRVLLAGVLIVGNVIMNVIGLIIGTITSQK